MNYFIELPFYTCIDRPVGAKVVPLSPAVVGTNLNLECQANSTSLPVDHQLPLIVEWRHEVKNQDKVKAEGARLLIHSVTLLDKELSYVCRASDGLDLWSNYSEPYILHPECKYM